MLENFHRFLSIGRNRPGAGQPNPRWQTDPVDHHCVGTGLELPPELEKLFVVVEHALPTREQLKEIAAGIGTEDGELPTGSELEKVLDAAGGLTRGEAESAYSLSLVRHGRIQPETIWELKSQTLKKSGLLELYEGDADFASLGGMSALKTFCQQALSSTGSNPSVKPRGVMLLSPPGCGKSQICKALGKETGRPVIKLDVGSLMGSLVGQTEQRTRQALQIIDAMQPCVVYLDELDKAFAGVAGSGHRTRGVSSRMFGTFLSWLNDRESDTFRVFARRTTSPSCRPSLPEPNVSTPFTFSTCQPATRKTRSGTFTSSNTTSTPISGSRMTRIGPGRKSRPVAGCRFCSTSR